MSPDDNLRTFIAAPLGSSVHTFLAQHQQRLAHQPWSKRIRWIAQENVHLTLRFLGDTTTAQVETLHRLLQASLTTLPAFDITVMQPGPFPTTKRPRVVAAPVKRNPTLEQLVATIETQVIKAGFKAEDRAFRGHITIGRVKRSIPGRDLLTDTPQSMHTRISRVVFMQSVLTPEGSVYTPLHDYPLLIEETATA